MEKFPLFLCYLWEPPLWSCDCQGNLFLFSMPFLQHKKRSLNSIELLFHLEGGERSGTKKRKKHWANIKCYITYEMIHSYSATQIFKAVYFFLNIIVLIFYCHNKIEYFSLPRIFNSTFPGKDVQFTVTLKWTLTNVACKFQASSQRITCHWRSFSLPPYFFDT